MTVPSIPPGAKVRVVGDVHGDATGFAYAIATERFIVQLGDLADHGPDSAGTLRMMFDLVENGRGLFILGNHDLKLGRVLSGDQVRIEPVVQATIDQMDDALKARTLRLVAEAPAWLRHGSALFVHGGFHTAMLEHPAPYHGLDRPQGALARALYGEPTGRTQLDGYPERSLRWVDRIPDGLTVYCGHDRRSHDGRPYIRHGLLGGTAVFWTPVRGRAGTCHGSTCPDLAFLPRSDSSPDIASFERREGGQEERLVAGWQTKCASSCSCGTRSPPGDDASTPDRDRPLNARGRRAAMAMRRAMQELGLTPDVVLVSTARRTMETLEALEPWDDAPLVEPMDSLYLADPIGLIGALHGVAATVRSVLVIGHNPGLHDLALILAGPSVAARTVEMSRALEAGFPTGTLAEFVVAASWCDLREGGGRLVRFLTPRMLEAAGRS